MNCECDKIKASLDYFDQGYKCSQSILAAFSEITEIEKKLLLKISKFLGSGLLYRGEMCGAVSGALMIYSLMFASDTPDNEVTDEIFYKLCSEHIKEFEKKHNSIYCRELLKRNISNSDDYEILQKQGVFDKECPKFVESSAKIIDHALKFIEEKKKKYPDMFSNNTQR